MEYETSLDPPGRVAVIGAGPLGIEAALYGRFLGYDVHVFESHEVAHQLAALRGQDLPMLPDRCVSPLALSALDAQNVKSPEPKRPLPVTVDEWIDGLLIPITETDLLRGRIHTQHHIAKLEHVVAETDDDEPVPPDFRLLLDSSEAPSQDGSQENSDDLLLAEAVIVATGQSPAIELGFETPAEYFFSLDSDPSQDAETQLQTGFQQIVQAYATIGGRADLDLYRPLRGN